MLAKGCCLSWGIGASFNGAGDFFTQGCSTLSSEGVITFSLGGISFSTRWWSSFAPFHPVGILPFPFWVEGPSTSLSIGHWAAVCPVPKETLRRKCSILMVKKLIPEHIHIDQVVYGDMPLLCLYTSEVELAYSLSYLMQGFIMSLKESPKSDQMWGTRVSYTGQCIPRTKGMNWG